MLTFIAFIHFIKPIITLMTHTFTTGEALHKNSVVQVPAYNTYDYLVILAPHSALLEKISVIKEAFAKKYKCPLALSTKPQLTLLKFTQTGIAEERIVNRLRTIASTQAAIKIELKDFGSYPSHTIYINVTSKVPLLNLSKALREAQALLKFNPDIKPFFLNEPHITIARKLVPWQHEKAWLEYSNSSFTGRFLANKMTLLKRKVDHLTYQHVADLEFRDEPVAATQG